MFHIEMSTNYHHRCFCFKATAAARDRNLMIEIYISLSATNSKLVGSYGYIIVMPVNNLSAEYVCCGGANCRHHHIISPPASESVSSAGEQSRNRVICCRRAVNIPCPRALSETAYVSRIVIAFNVVDHQSDRSISGHVTKHLATSLMLLSYRCM